MLDIIDHALIPEGAFTESASVRELCLNRPPVNALDRDLLRKLVAEISAAAKDAEALVITGQPNLFSAGLDVRAMLDADRAAMVALFVEVWRVQRAIATSSIPVIFGITGHSPAGGTVMAIHGDYRVMASGDFKIGLNEVQVGLYPGPVITGAFRRLVGGHAAQFLSRGALMDAATALRIGLVDELVEPASVVTRALAMAREFCTLPREAMQRTRALVRRDLVDLFGEPSRAGEIENAFAGVAADMWLLPETLARLRKAFARKSG
jgi:3,2-trans-enoyl-CoA isomerase